MFGGLGVAIDKPHVQLEIKASDTLRVTGLPCQEVEKLARQFYTSINQPPAANVEVISVIPAHVGLGSGTQLAMAVGMGLAKHHGLTIKEAEMARLMDRGAVGPASGWVLLSREDFWWTGAERFPAEGPNKEIPPIFPPLPFSTDFQIIGNS